jgi:hypothetical protein
MKKNKEILLPDIYEQLYLFKVKGIQLAKICSVFEKAKEAIKIAMFEEIEGAAEVDHRDTCSLFWKGYQDVDYRSGKTGWIPYINNNLFNYQAIAKDSFYFLEGGIAIDTLYNVRGGDKNNIPEIKSSFSYYFKPWNSGNGNTKFESAAHLSGVLTNIERKYFDYNSKKNANNSLFNAAADTLGFINYLYLVNFNKKVCERFSVFNTFAKIKEEIKICKKEDRDKDTFLVKELTKTIAKIKGKIGGLTGVFFDKLNVFTELEKINALILATKVDEEGLSLLGAILKINETVFNIQIFNKVENEGTKNEGMELERAIYDYFDSMKENHKEKNVELFKKLSSLNKEAEKFTNFLLGVLEKYKTRITIDLM